MCVWYKVRVKFHCFPNGYPVDSAPFVRIWPFPTFLQCHICHKSSDWLKVCLFFTLSLHSSGYIFICVFLTLSHRLNSHSFIVSHDKSSNFVLFRFAVAILALLFYENVTARRFTHRLLECWLRLHWKHNIIVGKLIWYILSFI